MVQYSTEYMYFHSARVAELGEIFVQKKQTFWLCSINVHVHCTSYQCNLREGEESGFCYPDFPLLCIAGPEGLMVCQTLVAIAAHTTNIWDHVTPKLMTYLESKVEDHHEILVSCKT